MARQDKDKLKLAGIIRQRELDKKKKSFTRPKGSESKEGSSTSELDKSIESHNKKLRKKKMKKSFFQKLMGRDK